MRVNIYTLKMDNNKLCYLAKEKGTLYKTEKERFTNPDSIYLLMQSVFDLNHLPEEHLYLLCFSTKGNLLGVFEVSHGCVDATFCNPREIMQRALLCNSSSIVLVHNHPSGNPEPSKNDISATKRIFQVGQLMGIPLNDHLIIGDSCYYSLAEKTDIFNN